MSTPSNLIDSTTGFTARIDKSGYLAVGPAMPSMAFNATLGVDDTPVQIVPAKGSKSFYVTSIILTGNKNISTTVDAVVDIYTSQTTASATIATSLLSIPIGRSAQTVITGILIETEAGYFINGKTSDDDVLVTILGYYVDA